MNCPRCNAKTKVVRTIKLQTFVYRIRCCLQCEYIFSSREDIVKGTDKANESHKHP